jgi:hypothetical protein
MPYQSYFRLGAPADEQVEPTPGNTYWVVLRTDQAEVAFQALLTTSVERDHKTSEQDQTPSYQFDNGVVVHGKGIRFFNNRPVKPLKGLRYCQIERQTERDDYLVLSELTEEAGDKNFKTLEALRQYLLDLDIDDAVIPKQDFIGRREFEVML